MAHDAVVHRIPQKVPRSLVGRLRNRHAVGGPPSVLLRWRPTVQLLVRRSVVGPPLPEAGIGSKACSVRANAADHAISLRRWGSAKPLSTVQVVGRLRSEGAVAFACRVALRSV